jgi:effector-binding domain-containing protein
MDYTFSVEEIIARPVLSIRTQSKPEDLGSLFGANFGEVSQYLARQGLSPAGMPFCRYHGFSEGEVDIDAGFPVDEILEGDGRIEASQLPAGRAAATYHMGPYENINAAHS